MCAEVMDGGPAIFKKKCPDHVTLTIQSYERKAQFFYATQ